MKLKFQKQVEEKLEELRKTRKEKQDFLKRVQKTQKDLEKQISEYEGAIIVLHELITGEKAT